MKAKELVELAGDPRFIPGVYNYCDRWRERRNFTAIYWLIKFPAEEEAVVSAK
ncbi:MAG TPA: hypothetical protein VIC84_09750 [Blastocatellia bacterium]